MTSHNVRLPQCGFIANDFHPRRYLLWCGYGKSNISEASERVGAVTKEKGQGCAPDATENGKGKRRPAVGGRPDDRRPNDRRSEPARFSCRLRRTAFWQLTSLCGSTICAPVEVCRCGDNSRWELS